MLTVGTLSASAADGIHLLSPLNSIATLGSVLTKLGLTGAGPQKIITDLGVLEPDPATCEFTMTGLYPGVPASAAREQTGWDLAVAAELELVPAPSPAELDALRSFTRGRS